MNNILDIIAEILGGAPCLGILPETPDTLTALFEYPGPPPTQYFGGVSYDYNVQVRTRAKKDSDAYSLSEAAQNKLSRYYNDQLSILQTSNILSIGQDTKGRREYAVNFQISMK